jgi:hypothetical protein
LADSKKPVLSRVVPEKSKWQRIKINFLKEKTVSYPVGAG